MKRAVVLIWLLVACGCARNAERQLAATLDEAKARRPPGRAEQARSIAERGLALAQPDSEWAWTFRLLRGEILLLQRQPAEVVPLVSAALPAAPSFDRLRARQKYLEALLLRSQNRFADALATLETARRLAPDARDVQFDIAWLDGQLRMRLGRVVRGRDASERVHRQRRGSRRPLSTGPRSQRPRNGRRCSRTMGRGAATIRAGTVVPGPPNAHLSTRRR